MQVSENVFSIMFWGTNLSHETRVCRGVVVDFVHSGCDELTERRQLLLVTTVECKRRLGLDDDTTYKRYNQPSNYKCNPVMKTYHEGGRDRT